MPEALYLGYRAFLLVFDGGDPHASALGPAPAPSSAHSTRRPPSQSQSQGERALLAGLRARWEGLVGAGRPAFAPEVLAVGCVGRLGWAGGRRACVAADLESVHSMSTGAASVTGCGACWGGRRAGSVRVE